MNLRKKEVRRAEGSILFISGRLTRATNCDVFKTPPAAFMERLSFLLKQYLTETVHVCQAIKIAEDVVSLKILFCSAEWKPDASLLANVGRV